MSVLAVCCSVFVSSHNLRASTVLRSVHKMAQRGSQSRTRSVAHRCLTGASEGDGCTSECRENGQLSRGAGEHLSICDVECEWVFWEKKVYRFAAIRAE
jgi:hypothetical protein